MLAEAPSGIQAAGGPCGGSGRVEGRPQLEEVAWHATRKRKAQITPAASPAPPASTLCGRRRRRHRRWGFRPAALRGRSPGTPARGALSEGPRRRTRRNGCTHSTVPCPSAFHDRGVHQPVERHHALRRAFHQRVLPRASGALSASYDPRPKACPQARSRSASVIRMPRPSNSASSAKPCRRFSPDLTSICTLSSSSFMCSCS